MGLTDEQQDVVNHPKNRHGRVLAGPGTGKSYTCVALLKSLYSQEKRPKVRFLTFTRAATAELALKLRGNKELDVKPSTFHSFAISAVLQNPGCTSFPTPLRIPDVWEESKVIRPHLARSAGLDLRRLDDLIKEMAAKWESLEEHPMPKVTPEMRSRFLGAFLDHRSAFSYTLIQELPDLLRQALEDQETLEGLDVDLLIIDEFQDLNACEIAVLEQLRDLGVCVLAVGDDDQSIYSFRRADPNGIRQFPKYFPNSKDYEPSVCHRCPQEILDWAAHIIAGDSGRAEKKKLTSCSVNKAKTGLLRFNTGIDEARWVAALIEKLHVKFEVPLSEILVMYRTDPRGAFTSRVKAELDKRDIPYLNPHSVRQILMDEANRELIALLKLLNDPLDSIGWLSLMVIRKGFGPAVIDAIFQEAKARNETFGRVIAAWREDNFEDLSPMYRNKMLDLYDEVSAWLLEREGLANAKITSWGAWLEEKMDERIIPAGTMEFMNLCKAVDAKIEKACDVSFYLGQLQPLGEDLQRAKSQAIRFMSMSGSKGLTVRAAIIIGAENDLIPRPGADRAEERRLLYFAMTRATEFLYLTWAAKRTGSDARSGKANTGVRQPCEYLRGGLVRTLTGASFVNDL